MTRSGLLDDDYVISLQEPPTPPRMLLYAGFEGFQMASAFGYNQVYDLFSPTPDPYTRSESYDVNDAYASPPLGLTRQLRYRRQENVYNLGLAGLTFNENTVYSFAHSRSSIPYRTALSLNTGLQSYGFWVSEQQETFTLESGKKLKVLNATRTLSTSVSRNGYSSVFDHDIIENNCVCAHHKVTTSVRFGDSVPATGNIYVDATIETKRKRRAYIYTTAVDWDAIETIETTFGVNVPNYISNTTTTWEFMEAIIAELDAQGCRDTEITIDENGYWTPSADTDFIGVFLLDWPNSENLYELTHTFTADRRTESGPTYIVDAGSESITMKATTPITEGDPFTLLSQGFPKNFVSAV